VREGSGFKPVEVQVQRVTESRVVLAGLPPDADVALADPDGAARGGANGPETAPPMPGGAR
jgi:hypothetical protein